MKNLKNFLNSVTEGFTVDDELAAQYIFAFENDDFGQNDELKDIDLWWSLGLRLNKYVLDQARFTGCLGEDTDTLEVIKISDFDSIFLQACEIISNANNRQNPIDDDWGHIVMCYDGHKPFDLTDLNHEDWKDYEFAINPRALRWKNCLNKSNLKWMIWNDLDSVWIRNSSAYKSLVDYTGWSIWKNGKCIAGQLAMSKIR